MNINKLFLSLTFTVTASLCSSVNAEVYPVAVSAKDSRIQVINYDPDNVVVLKTKVGNSLLIQLENDEVIDGSNSGLAMGDAKAWSLAVKGNNIFLKPAKEMPDTNMIIVTNKRQYTFSLITAKDQSVGYVIRFKYPDSERKNAELLSHKQDEINQKLALENSLNQSASKKFLNLNYFKKGDLAISPSRVWDNNQFTFFKFNNAKALPAVYKLNDDGTEALVNTHIENDVLIVHETAKIFYLRLGNSVLEIKNAKYDAAGMFNSLGTSDDKSMRLEKGKAE